MHPGPNPLLITLITVLILLPLMVRRIRKMTKPQPLKLGRLWIRPALILLICALALFAPQPVVRHFSLIEWGWMVLAGISGAYAGWHMGRTMAIEVHPEDGTLMTRGSIAAIIVIVALILLRLGLHAGLALEARAWHLDALLISDAAIVFTAALFTVRSLEMYLRAQQLTKANRAA